MRTCRQVPRVGLMLVGWGGNNGSTVTAAVAANRMGLRWNTKDGQKAANYYGSITQASTVSLGTDQVFFAVLPSPIFLGEEEIKSTHCAW